MAKFSRLLFPPIQRCSLCNTALEEPVDDGLCSQCLSLMPKISAPLCPRCGRPDVFDASFCPDCQTLPPSFTTNRSLWLYQDQAKEILQLFKFNKRPHLAYLLAHLLSELYQSQEFSSDLLTFVPMSNQAMRLRGYNQSTLVTAEIARILSLPMTEVLVKDKKVKAQHFLSREERWLNLNDQSFHLNKPLPPNAKVLLVDDVFTTGATAHFCSLALLRGGASEVRLLTVARAIV